MPFRRLLWAKLPAKLQFNRGDIGNDMTDFEWALCFHKKRFLKFAKTIRRCVVLDLEEIDHPEQIG